AKAQPGAASLFRSSLDVAERFQLTEQVVHRLLGHSGPGRKIGRTHAVRRWIDKDIEKRFLSQVAESARRERRQLAPPHCLIGHAHEGADEWCLLGQLRSGPSLSS